MTDWQWKVIVALCKCVLHLFKYVNIEDSPELSLLQEAISREQK